MTIPSKGRRLTVISKSIRAGAKEIRTILIKARDRMDLLILRSAQAKNFMTSATVRNKLYSNLGVEYAALQFKVNDWSKRHVTRTARTWRKFGINDVPAKDYNQTWKQFDKKYLRDMIERVNPETGTKVTAVNARLGGMLENDIRTLRESVIQVTRQGAETGMTAQQQQRELLARVTRERPAWSFIDKAGKRWDSKNYFKMLNETISANVSRESYQDVLAEAGHDLVTIEGGPSTSEDASDPCNRWFDKIVSLNGTTPGFPTADEARADGLFHPRCRHYYGVVLPDELPEAKEQETEADIERREIARKAREEQERKRIEEAEKTLERAKAA